MKREEKEKEGKTEPTYYNPGQFVNILPYLLRTPRSLILGGPADANEAQTACEFFPYLRVIGIEPSPELYKWQLLEGRWPIKNGPLLNKALSDQLLGTARLKIPENDPRCSSLQEERQGSKEIYVETITIDSLYKSYLLQDCILWLDIEGMEYQALLGAKEFLASGNCLLINVEKLERMHKINLQIDRYLESFGYKKVHSWNIQTGIVCDEVFILG